MRPTVRITAAAIHWKPVNNGGSPFVPFGHLFGAILCRHLLTDGSSELLLRDLTPSFDLRLGRCVWTAEPVAVNLSRPREEWSDSPSLEPSQDRLLRAAPFLCRAIEFVEPDVTTAAPTLPYTIAAIPKSACIHPQASPAVMRIARETGKPWQTVWERLARDRAIDSTGTLQWVDARLLSRLRPGQNWPGALALEMDLRGVPRIYGWQPPENMLPLVRLCIDQPHALLEDADSFKRSPDRFIPHYNYIDDCKSPGGEGRIIPVD
jgi:hypothetical protein